jgi:large subunit ribosomal protein L3
LVKPNKIELLRTKEKDGYDAVQVSLGKIKREFRTTAIANYKPGDSIQLSAFKEGDLVRVSGVSKGKGFQGVVKRYGFHGGPRTHGQKHSEREIGSIGATGPQRVFKGKKMPGRMGNKRVTVENLRILKINNEAEQVLISGAIPGRKGTVVEIRSLD